MKKWKQVPYLFLCVVISAVMLLPMYYLLVTTFKTPAQAAASPLGLPPVLNFDNYSKAFHAMNYVQALMNNLLITVVSVLCLLFVANSSRAWS